VPGSRSHPCARLPIRIVLGSGRCLPDGPNVTPWRPLVDTRPAPRPPHAARAGNQALAPAGPSGRPAAAYDARVCTGEPILVEDVAGSTRPAAYYLAESRDGLYVPYVVRTPAGDGPFPFVFLGYGNGGGGIGWLRQWVHTRPYLLERLLAAGYACGWGRYRTEVDLGFNRGGPLMVAGRQGMEVMNRSPLEFEDEVAILERVRRHPWVDAGNLGHIGISHAGEMLFKLAYRYPGMLRAGVASEPANHEFLDLRLGDVAPVSPGTGLRDIEEMQLQDPEWVRARANLPVARERIAPIDMPILVMGRDGDHLQGVFRLSYELLEEAGKDAEWVSWDHPLHGYIAPLADAAAGPDPVAERAIDGVIAFLDRHMKPGR
jgi:dienelactone hydrolase